MQNRELLVQFPIYVTIGSPFFLRPKTLTALAFRNPHGMSLAHAACDLLLLGCRAFGNYFTCTFL